MSKKLESENNDTQTGLGSKLKSIGIRQRKLFIMHQEAEELDPIGRLDIFATHHKNFFRKGLAGESKDRVLNPDPVRGYTNEFAQRIVKQRIHLDFEIWLQIFMQRQTKNSVKATDTVPLTLETDSLKNKPSMNFTLPIQLSDITGGQLIGTTEELEKILQSIFITIAELEWVNKLSQSDHLAQHALNLAKEIEYFQFLDYVPKAWSYFSTRASMRVVPYVPLAMVAVPYTAMEEPQDLLAIPHEIGHYVYWYGKIREDPDDTEYQFIHQMTLKDDPDIWIEWGEEIFADVFGIIVAGGLLAIDFMNYLQSEKYPDFEKSDGQHPIPALRPVIYYTALKYFKPYVGAETVHACNLRTHWLEQLNKRGINETTLFEVGKQSINIIEFEEQLTDLFDKKSAIFDPMKKSDKIKTKTWINLIKDDTKYIEDSPTSWLDLWENLITPDLTPILRMQSALSLKELLGLKDNIPIVLPPAEDMWQKWFDERNFVPNDGSNTWEPKDWLRVLDAGDWTIEGPHASKHDD